MSRSFSLAVTLLASLPALADPPPVVPAQPLGQPVVQVNPFLLPVVRQMLYDRSGSKREDAAEDLEDIGDASCLPVLQWSADNDPKSGVRRHARKAIEKIQRRLPPPMVVAAPWPPAPVVLERRNVPVPPVPVVPAPQVRVVPPPPDRVPPPPPDRVPPPPAPDRVPPPPQPDGRVPAPPVPQPLPEFAPPPPPPAPAVVPGVWMERSVAVAAVAPAVWYSKCWHPARYGAFGSGFGRL